MYRLRITFIAYRQTPVITTVQRQDSRILWKNFYIHTSETRRQLERSDDRRTEKSDNDNRIVENRKEEYV